MFSTRQDWCRGCLYILPEDIGKVEGSNNIQIKIEHILEFSRRYYVCGDSSRKNILSSVIELNKAEWWSGGTYSQFNQGIGNIWLWHS